MKRELFEKNLPILSGISIGVACLISASSASAFSLSDVLGKGGDTLTSVCETEEPMLDQDGKPTQSLVPVLPGEEHFLRDDLGATTTIPLSDKLSIAYFYLMTDIHITDEEAPSRLIFFDFLVDSAWRPQEDRAVHVFDAALQTGNGLMETYGRDFDFVMSLGDNVDNAQDNEITWFIQALKGAEGLNPDSGDEGRTFGNQTSLVYVDGNSNDAFEALGLKEGIPFYTAVGNHDALWTGTFAEPLTNPDLFVGERSPLGFLSIDHPGFRFNQLPVCVSTAGCDDFLLAEASVAPMSVFGMAPMRTDQGVSEMESYEFVGEFLSQSLGKVQSSQTFDDRQYVNHDHFVERMKDEGFVLISEDVPENMGYYYFDAEEFPVRYIVMDTEDRPWLSEGGVSNEQFAWIEQKIWEATDSSDPRLVVIMSHHEVEDGLVCILCDYKDGEDLRDLFCEYPNVIMVLNGHGHDNRVLAQQCREEKPSDGFWEVETASLIDFPQQTRIAEIAYNYDGTGSVLLTMVNHQSHELGHIANRSRGDSWKDLNDPRKNRLELDEEGEIWKVTGPAHNPKYSLTGRGTRDDRNVELVFSVPQNIAELLEDMPGEVGTTTQLFYDCPTTPCGGCSAANASSRIRYSAGQAALDFSVYMLPIVLVLGWHRRKSLFKLVRM